MLRTTTPKHSKVRGVVRFAEFLRDRKIAYSAAARALHVSVPTVWAWRHGWKLPVSGHQEAIEIWTSGFVRCGHWKLPGVRKNAAKVRPYANGRERPKRQILGVAQGNSGQGVVSNG